MIDKEVPRKLIKMAVKNYDNPHGRRAIFWLFIVASIQQWQVYSITNAS